MTREDFLKLYEKYLQGNCTPEDNDLLKTYIDDFELLDLPWKEEMGSRDQVKSQIYNKLHEQIETPIPSIKKLNWFNWRIAASILVVLSLGVYFLTNNHSFLSTKLAQNNSDKAIVPGGNKAILTLANGKTVVLDTSAKGKIANEAGVSISKNADGQLVYQIDNVSGQNSNAYNSISTDPGGQYQVILPDGTQVFLNAASNISFPVSFAGNERKIKLKGEAYFEVAKDKARPFIVAVNSINVTVLGTHFNIKAYEGDKAIKTTLLEGSVRLSSPAKNVVLVPGQQGIVNTKNFNIEVAEVNGNQVMAWKNGYFMFVDDPIEEIMEQIGRWYNVDIEYQGDLSNKTFGGVYSRNKDINELLKGLELTGLVHFKIEGRRIIVMP